MSMQGSDGGALRGYQKGEESLRHHLTKLIQREFRNVLSQGRALYVHTDDDEIGALKTVTTNCNNAVCSHGKKQEAVSCLTRSLYPEHIHNMIWKSTMT